MTRLTTEKRLALLLKRTNKTGRVVNETLGHCWEWMGAKKEGYGLYSKRTCHRLSWELHNGQTIPDNTVVRHKCDNRACLNPEHLELGTVQDNIADKVARGRATGGSGRRGANGTNTKLTTDQVKEIRENPHGCTMDCMAHRFGCSTSQISRIMHNDRWSELDEHQSEDELFWSRAIKGKRVVNSDLGECWETSRERQLISYRNHKALAHRTAYTIQHGDIPEGMLVRHKCDNDKCINPEHLELGTHKENMEDRSKRGRTCKGAQHHSAKLTDTTALEIYNLRGSETMTEVAKRFGITKQIVCKLWKKQSWKHIHEPSINSVDIPTIPS
jgi:hypothetical protein